MRKRRALLLLALLLFVGIPTDYVVSEYRREQANRDLIVAIKKYDTKGALAALRAGADPNCRDHSDNPPRSFSEHIKQFFDKVLHLSMKTEHDKSLTALLLAIHTVDYFYIENKPFQKDNPILVKVLLDAGADANLTGGESADTPLMWAANCGHPISLRLLLQYGGNPNIKNNLGNTALFWATESDDTDAITCFLTAKANINEQNGKGETPLHIAARHRDFASTKTLLQNHANPNLLDKSHRPPLDWALSAYRMQTITLLRQAGAKTSQELSSQPTH